jgi:hypothetical protein
VGGETGTCLSGPGCKAFDPVTTQPHPSSHPLCRACLDAAERDIRGLVYDYLDLAQLHEPAMSQAIDEKTSGGSHESPMLLAGHIEELQAEIVHVLSVWEYEIRVAYRLSDPRTFAPLWRRTVYDHLELTAGARQLRPARPGAIVQRAVGILACRVDRLAALPPTVVCATGVEDQPVEMCGWEAIHQLQGLHSRARGALGRTTRKFWIPGECWTCDAAPIDGVDGPLWRSEPRHDGDPMEVHCGTCGASRFYADYETRMATLRWPTLEAAA